MYNINPDSYPDKAVVVLDTLLSFGTGGEARDEVRI